MRTGRTHIERACEIYYSDLAFKSVSVFVVYAVTEVFPEGCCSSVDTVALTPP